MKYPEHLVKKHGVKWLQGLCFHCDPRICMEICPTVFPDCKPFNLDDEVDCTTCKEFWNCYPEHGFNDSDELYINGCCSYRAKDVIKKCGLDNGNSTWPDLTYLLKRYVPQGYALVKIDEEEIGMYAVDFRKKR